MQYILLVAAIIFEIIATSFLKYSDGFTRLYPTIACIVFYVLCYLAFGKAMVKLDLNMSYAIWCGVGIVATTLISVLFFKEKISVYGIVGIVLIIIGGILLNLGGTK